MSQQIYLGSAFCRVSARAELGLVDVWPEADIWPNLVCHKWPRPRQPATSRGDPEILLFSGARSEGNSGKAFLGHASLQNIIICYFDFELRSIRENIMLHENIFSAILRSNAQAKVPCLIKYASNIKILRDVI